MKKYFLSAAVLAIGFFLGFAPAAFPETAVASKNGLFPEEIVSADGLKKMFDGREDFVLFDARDKKTYDHAHIEGAILPRTEDFYRQEELFRNGILPKSPDPGPPLKDAMQKYSYDTRIVTYCNSNCHAGSVLALQLKTLGFTDVKSMEEGIQVWEKKGYPVTRSEGTQKIS